MSTAGKQVNIGHHLSEFQVVILAGGTGHRMYPLTESVPKALLPVCNRPLLNYQIELLEKAGFVEAIVVTTEDHSTSIRKFIQQYSSGQLFESSDTGATDDRPAMAIDLQIVENQCGTADALRQIRNRIKTDFIVVASDLITEGCIHDLADIHRTRQGTVTMLLKEEVIEDPSDKRASSTSNKPKLDEDLVDYIGIVEEDKHKRVVFMSSAADLEDNLVLPKSLLKQHCDLTINTNLVDAHIYIFAHWVLELLEHKKHLTTIKGDLLPHLARSQFRPKTAFPEEVLECAISQQSLAMGMSASNTSTSTSASSSSATASSMGSSSSSAGSDGDGTFAGEEFLRCYAHVLRPNVGFCCRANTLANYGYMNRVLATLPRSDQSTPWPRIPVGYKEVKDDSSKAKYKFKDCVVGDGCEIHAQSLKACVIGKGSKIGAKSRLNQCIVMDNVTIGSNCTLQNTVICSNAVVQDKVSLNSCEVGYGAVVLAGGKYKKEQLLKGGD